MNLKKLFGKKKDLSFSHTVTIDDVWCSDCYWRMIKRHQKCSCCRRNQNMKDNYVSIETAQEGAVERE